MKRVLSIQDLSCVGKCSITVALPILSAMGISCSVLPTAILSTHTEFPGPHIHSLTEDMVPICRHWKTVGADFDAILVGYLSDPQQAEAVLEIMDAFDCPVILDPVMGDHGKRYNGITQAHTDALRDLSTLAQVLLPNVTEAALLTGLPYQEQTDGHYLRTMLERLCMGHKTQTVIITGTEMPQNATGFAGIQKGEGLFSYRAVRRAQGMPGTGDMFSAVFTGAFVLGKDPVEAGELAAKFVERVLDDSQDRPTFGANFEKQLPWLWEQL